MPKRHKQSQQLNLFDLGPDGPTFDLETRTGGIVCGVDEVGRGPWAGPVVAAAVILTPGDIPEGLDDSKKLTSKRLNALAEVIHAKAKVGIGQASVEEIDEVNILQATFLAMQRAVDKLDIEPDHALIDGNHVPRLNCPASAIIKGDARSLSIAAASIVAKKFRDDLMKKLAKDHPEYSWDTNAGYGTRHHRDALALVGVTTHHRRSFAPIREILTQDSALTY